MKVVILNKSDSLGGAAIVSRRLLDALLQEGIDARMLTVHCAHPSARVQPCAPAWRAKIPFLTERLDIYMHNGRNRATLFQADTASAGLPLHRHPWVREADIIVLGWVNQGMLSLREIERLGRGGRPLVCVMHDLWCATGVCHHSGSCERFQAFCGDCPLLGTSASPRDISASTMARKRRLYASTRIAFVAVSHWLARRAALSSLPLAESLHIIPNPFRLPPEPKRAANARPKIAIGAARLDDPIKGLPDFLASLRVLAERGIDAEVVAFGGIRNRQLLSGTPLPINYLGMIAEEEVARLMAYVDVVVSSSSYETLPGTLVEAQACGAVPVAFDHGGQSDIITHLQTGYLVAWSDDAAQRAVRLADGIEWALRAASPEMRVQMRAEVMRRFDARAVARKFINLFGKLLQA